MENEFSKFYKLAIKSFIEDNLDSSIYNTTSIIGSLEKYEDGMLDDVTEFLDDQIYLLLQEKLNIKF